MSDFEKLIEAARPYSERVREVAESDSEICVVTHIDADGISSGSIVGLALSRLGAKFCVRCVSDFNHSVLETLKRENHDFLVITDLGAGFSDQIRKSLGDKWIVIDHHQIPEEEKMTDDSNQVFNSWKYGIDGSTRISAGGMAFVLAYSLDGRNDDLSLLAVISAVADRQDQGEKRALLGVNEEIAKKSQSLGLIQADLDIMLAGRETRPCHEALAYTSYPYIDGLTWHPDACYNLLIRAGIKLRDNGRWKVVTELSQEEKSTLIDAIAKYVSAMGKSTSSIIDSLIGFVYTLSPEDVRSQLRDARDFGTLLNACGRMGRAGVGVAVCLGDRSQMLLEAEKISSTYRGALRASVSSIFSDKWRIVDRPSYVLVNGDGLIGGEMLGAISSLLSGSPAMEGKIILVRTLLTDGSDSYKFSCRKGFGSTPSINLGLLMRESAAAVHGIGGGHAAAAGCRIPAASINDFIDLIRSAIGDSILASSSPS